MWQKQGLLAAQVLDYCVSSVVSLLAVDGNSPLEFERKIFVLLPALVIIFVSPFYIQNKTHGRVCVGISPLFWAKMVGSPSRPRAGLRRLGLSI
jgi:hypothetical protein